MNDKYEKVQKYFIELLFPILSTVFIIYYYLSTTSLHYYSVIYPRIITILLLLAIAAEVTGTVLKWIKEGQSKQQVWVEKNSRAVVVLLATIIFIILFTHLGFCVSLFLYMGFMSYYLGSKKITIVIFFAIFSTLIFYVVFVYLLSLPMPKGILF